MSVTVPPRLDWSAGNATLTTVLSIKAMLEPRIVAARIHRPDVPGHGTSALTDRTSASSGAGLMKPLSARRANAANPEIHDSVRPDWAIRCGTPIAPLSTD